MYKAPNRVPLRDRLEGTERRFSDTDYDRFDYAILQMCRCFFQSFANPQSHTWTVVYDMTDNPSFDWDGPAVAAQAFRMVKAMQVARKSDFRFSNPLCVHCSQVMTPQERQLIGCLSQHRRGCPERAKAHAILLCESNPIDELMNATAALANFMPDLVSVH